MMKVEKFVLCAMSTNTYLVENEELKELIIVDPAACPDYMVSHIRTMGYEPKAIFLTHGHFDHIMGIDKWLKEFDIPVYAHRDEREVLEDAKLNLSCMLGMTYTFKQIKELEDGDVLKAAGFAFKVIHTPGHTKGGCCYYEEGEEVLFSGDTLFRQSIGRSDFPTGDMSTLVRSIKEKIFVLPDEIMVYPGHNDYTCIADEKRKNPFV